MTLTRSNVDPLPADPVEWGDHRLVINVAGGPYLFTGMSEDQFEIARRRFHSFTAEPIPSSTPLPTIRFLRAPVSCFVYPDLVGEEYPLSTRSDEQRVVVDGYRFAAEISISPKTEGRVWTAVATGDEFLSVFENPFRATVAYRLLDTGGVLLHSAAVVDNGRVFVFYGRSGSGKSTLSHLAAASGRTVLSDDLNTLTTDRGATFARAVPFAGDIRGAAPSENLPIHALLRLEKGKDIGARRTSPAVSMASLIACSPFVNADGFRSRILEKNLQTAQQPADLGVLTFPRGADFDDILAAVEEMT